MSLTNAIRQGSKSLRPWFNTKSGTSLDFTIKKASGCYFYDKNNNPIIDFTSGLMVTNLGHNNRIINESMKKTINNGLLYLPPSILIDERERLSERLIELSPYNDGKVFYTNGGADSNEAAIYFIKRHFKDNEKKNRILRFNKSFHGGSTYISSYLGGDSRKNEKINHFDFDFKTDSILPNPLLSDGGKKSLKKITKKIKENHENIAAILIEGSSGTAGCYVYPQGYYNEIEKLAKKYDILLVVDEVMSGFGRTGKLFGYQHYSGNPDIITLAKGLTNGAVPMGATIISDKLSKDYEDFPVNNGLTYSGHPLACSAANASLDQYNNELFLNVILNEDILKDYFSYLVSAYPGIVKEFRGLGLLYCIEFYNGHVDYVQKALLNKGVYTFYRDNNLFIAPPLIISKSELEQTLQKINEVVMFVNSNC